MIAEREALYKRVESELQYPAEIYQLGDRFKGLSPAVAEVTVLDVTEIPGCHYGAKNIFVPIIHHLEQTGTAVGKKPVTVSPETAILVEPSTGNGWVAFSDAAKRLGYEHFVVMPDGLPESRYRHPSGRPVEVRKSPEEDYAAGMPKALMTLLMENRGRLAHGQKIYVTPNHAVGAADITIREMAELGRQVLRTRGDSHEPLRVVASMGNGASLVSLGEHVKEQSEGARVVATESFAYGGGYDRFAKIRGRKGYRDMYGIEPGTQALMDQFSMYGTNAPIGIELPLQTRAMEGNLIDNYVLVADDAVLGAYYALQPTEEQRENARQLPNYSKLPTVLYEAFGNSTLANIATAAEFTQRGEQVVAVAYDDRYQYAKTARK